ncbi:MAG: alanine--tRNA ligase [Bacteroidetes bacterium]|nr:alanine--tRNA ligase [Bacteroidota bacterium]
MTAAQIRQAFLDFFASKGHVIVPSAPIVVKNDPTLLFTNAGMNQFKDFFLGNRIPEHRRVVDTQKCLRVSGKHNDLEEVGVDTYHHTMFEMLGNWSFGDYFKNEAIGWSWELLTEVYQIPKDRLYATVFEGDAKEGLHPSSIALAKWKELLPEDRIVFGNKKDNFWEMGDTGPCGPCSEIHVDCRPDEERKKIPGRDLVNKDHPQVIEIWNNVFIQFNRKKDGSLEPLPATHVDTGMGLERLVRVLQGKSSNYDTDIFSGTITATEQITGRRYDGSDTREAVAFRVIADHIRAIGFTIADGQLPSNTGVGYVIRRILRRAVRYYYSYLNYQNPLLHQLIPVLAKQFEGVFPELQQQVDFVRKVVREEEESFLRTLEKGLKRMDDILHSATRGTVAGKDAFELYDTYGFPIDLTRLIAQENQLQVDESGFEQEMKQQKDRSRAAGAIDAQDWIVLAEGGSVFVGYDSLSASAQIRKYRKVTAKGKTAYQVVLDTTPFYAESGGQVGDQGWLIAESNKYEVTDTKKDNDLIIHFLTALPVDPAQPLQALVNAELRNLTTVHHSATHLLHSALRQVLGTHVAQKGSLVNAGQLRFDFSHFAKVTDAEAEQIEQLVNQKIRENIPVVIKTLPKDEALKLGAMALFGEKYGDVVRVVIMDPNYSIELCGGTHVGSTGELGLFSILSESAVAAGVRRLEAVSGSAAIDWMQEQTRSLRAIKEVLKTPTPPVKAIEQMQEDLSHARKHLEGMEAKQLQLLAGELEKTIVSEKGRSFLGAVVEIYSADALKKLCHDLRSRGNDRLVVLVASIQGKAAVAIGISEALVKSSGLNAGKIIKEVVAPLIQGGGGGQPGLATAGGQDISSLNKVLEVVKVS